MKFHDVWMRIGGVLLVLGSTAAGYVLWARPYQLTWGARQEEVQRVYPGDELMGEPDFLATRAITIQAPPEEIWPWLIQMGYGRAGFYGYDILENQGSERGIYSAEKILPQYQNFQTGDQLPISFAVLNYFAAVEPGSHLVWSSLEGEHPGALTWALYPDGENQTRLVSRIGWEYPRSGALEISLALFTEFTDHLAVRKILTGLKNRVEGTPEPFWIQNFEFGIFVISWLIFAVSFLLILVRPFSWTQILVSLVAGTAWLIIWYGPIPSWGAGLLGLTQVFGVFRVWN